MVKEKNENVNSLLNSFIILHIIPFLPYKSVRTIREAIHCTKKAH